MIMTGESRNKGKGKSKVHPITVHEGLGGGGWSTPRPDRFIHGKDTRYPLYMGLGGPQGWSGRVRKISPPPGFDPRTIQPVASHYTDWAISANKGESGNIGRKTTLSPTDLTRNNLVSNPRPILMRDWRLTAWAMTRPLKLAPRSEHFPCRLWKPIS